jgi:thioredoxin 1
MHRHLGGMRRRIPEAWTGIPVNRGKPVMSPTGEHGIAEPTNLVEQTFDETLAATHGLVTVDFWAPWCGPCRAIAPVLEELVEELGGRATLMKVNVDESPTLAARYGVRSIPTLRFFKEGTLVDRVVGAVPKIVLQGILSARAS